MKAFLEYIPLIFFLIVYKMDERLIELGGTQFTLGGIYSATAFLMASTVVVYGFFWFKDKSLSRMQWIVVGAVLVFGTTTLLLHSETVLKWKAPVVNWVIAAIFLGSQYIGEKNMAKTMFDHMVTMPQTRWNRLNMGWVVVFLIVGTTNLIVAFNFHEYWVDFKVFGSFGMILIATIAQIAYIYPYLDTEEPAAQVATSDATDNADKPA